LSGEDPVPVEVQGDIKKTKKVWIEWGCDRGYIE